jgi:hypothetical protein
MSRDITMEQTTGFEPATLTLEKKVMNLARRLGSSPLSGLLSAGLSAQSAESARLRRRTLSALNLCERPDGGGPWPQWNLKGSRSRSAADRGCLADRRGGTVWTCGLWL